MELSSEILSDITVHMKYARYLEDKYRRETFVELVDRNKSMHIKKFPHLKDEIEAAYKFVYEKKVLPSMRSMQFGGKPIEVAPNRVFNCAYMPIDNIDSFSESPQGSLIEVKWSIGCPNNQNLWSFTFAVATIHLNKELSLESPTRFILILASFCEH